MNVLPLNSCLKKLTSLGICLLKSIMTDAILFAGCFALYGIVFAGFGAQVQDESALRELVLIGALFGIAGMIIGSAAAILREINRDYSSPATKTSASGAV